MPLESFRSFLACLPILFALFVLWGSCMHRRQSWGWGSRDPQDFGMGCSWWIVGSLWNIVISNNVQKYEMRTLSKVMNFQKWNDLCINKQKFRWWYPQLCARCLPPSIELLGLTTPPFSNQDPRPPVLKPYWRLCLRGRHDSSHLPLSNCLLYPNSVHTSLHVNAFILSLISFSCAMLFSSSLFFLRLVFIHFY